MRDSQKAYEEILDKRTKKVSSNIGGMAKGEETIHDAMRDTEETLKNIMYHSSNWEERLLKNQLVIMKYLTR